jgi:hypothetical protein
MISAILATFQALRGSMLNGLADQVCWSIRMDWTQERPTCIIQFIEMPLLLWRN